MYDLDQNIISKINKYIFLPGLQNEKRLENYIDYILNIKAGKSIGSYKSKKRNK